MERTLALSDLHLGRVTTYAHAPEVIAPLVEGFDRVLLLGDIIDHWYTQAEQARDYEGRLRDICKKAGVRKMIYFRGNHDACTDEGKEFALVNGILYLHGHAVYHRLAGAGCAHTRIKALNRKKFGSEMIASRFDHKIWKVVDRIYGTIPMVMLNPVAWPWHVMWRIKNFVEEVAPEGEIKGVVLGHSHRPGARAFGGLSLFNLGGWMKNTRAYGFMQEGRSVKLVRIENRGPDLRWGEALYDSELDLPLDAKARSRRAAKLKAN